MATCPIGPAANLSRDPGRNDRAPVSPSNIQDVVGPWHRFAPVGPIHEIVGVGDARPEGGRLMRIRVLETSEEVDHRLVDVLDDPRER